MKEPKIRFKGFSGEWKRSTLGDLALFSKGSGYSKSDICKEGTPVILYGRMYTKYQSVFDEIDTFVNPKDNSVVSKGGEVIIPGSGESSEDISLAAMVKNEGVILGGDLNILKFNQKVNDPAFMSMAITYSPTRAELSSYSQGKTVVHLRNSEIAKGTIRYPNILEQNTIVNYVLSLDAQISASTSRLASLKQMKAASLQAMFPQEGETMPKVRFKGFEGEWKTRSLNYYAKKRTEKNVNRIYNVTLTNSAEFGIIDQRQFFDHDISNSENIDGYFVVRDKDFVYNPRISASAPVGPINQNKLGYPGVMSPLYLVFEVKGINHDFLEIYFHTALWHKYMFDNGNSGARFDRLTISDDDFMRMPIPDISLAEQQSIASFFTSLDRQIALHTQRLEKLKQIKAACLDKMFV
ncbi:restriction endonuclease subunit S [Prevotellamassilia timonensis]|jgi:type I restriction enzyme S subunit|uniref:restriction endonuclease subunit S n=1 Tax=Prevotellamassilia timonensis TaxID=1852370 RepID=UPI003A91948F